jgi:PAS domain S-box-containing protein
MTFRARIWLVVLLGGTTLTIAAWGMGEGIQAPVAAALGIAPAVAARVAMAREPKKTKLPWLFFFWAATGFLLSSIVRQALVVADVSASFPSPADAGVMASYLSLICAFYLAGSIRSAGRNAAAQVDGLILAVAASAVVWTLVLAPYMADPTVPLSERAINLVFTMLTTLALATTTRLAVSPGARTTSYYLLAAAVAMLFANDVLATLASVGGTTSSASLVLAPLVSTFFAAAALHPDSRRLLEPPTDRVMRLTTMRTTLLAAALLVGPGMVAWAELTGAEIDVPVLVIASVVISGLVLVRLWMLVGAQQHTANVQRVLQEANANLAAASSRHAMHRGALRAVLRLAADRPGLRVAMAQVAGNSLRIVDALGDGADAAVGTSITMDRVPAELVTGLSRLVPAQADDVLPIDLGATAAGGATTNLFAAPLISQGDLSGAIIVSSDETIDVDLASNIATLASTVSLALESAVLTENLLRRRSERRFRALVENSSDIVLVIDPDRQISFASPAAQHLLGLSEKALLRSHPARWVHPEDWPALARLNERTTNQTHPASESVEVRFTHVDGSHPWFEVRTRDLSHDPEIQGLVLTAREISDRKATEQQLAASEARFRALVQSSSDVVAVIGENGCFTYMSPAVSQMLGHHPDDLVGTTCGPSSRATPSSATAGSRRAASPPDGWRRSCATATASCAPSTSRSPTCAPTRPWAASCSTPATSRCARRSRPTSGSRRCTTPSPASPTARCSPSRPPRRCAVRSATRWARCSSTSTTSRRSTTRSATPSAISSCRR